MAARPHGAPTLRLRSGQAARLLAAAVISCVVVGVACSPAVKRQPVTPVIVDEKEAAEPDWTITRADYEAAIKEGLQKVMRWYFVQPAYRGDAFAGYTVMDIYREGLRKGPIRVGDVIVRVNDMPLERPEHALAVWRDLWGLKKLKLDLLRDGKQRIYDIPIVE